MDAAEVPLAETSLILNLRSFVCIEATRREIVYSFQMNVASLPRVDRLIPLVASAEHDEPPIIVLNEAVGSDPQQKAFLTGKARLLLLGPCPPSTGFEITTSWGPPSF